MKIKYVEIHNILSIEDIRVNFEDSGLVLIDGWNHDDDTSNGSGKTAILNSIVYGLYGQFPRNITVSNLLRHNTKSGHVKVGVEVGNTLYEVSRGRPSHLDFFIDGVTKPDFSQEQFQAKIQIDYALYLLIVYSSQFQYTNIIQINDSDKKDFFLQLLNLDKFSNQKKLIDSKLKVARETLSNLKLEEKSTSSKIETLKDMLVDVEDLQRRSMKENVPQLVEQYNDKKSQLLKPDISKIEQLEENLTSRYEELIGLDSEIKQKKRRQEELKKSLSELAHHNIHSMKCPQCESDLVLSASGITTAEDIKTKNNRKITDIETALKSISDDIVSASNNDEEKLQIKDTIKKCKDKKQLLMEEYNETMYALNELKSNITAAKQRVAHYNMQIEKNEEIQGKIFYLNNRSTIIVNEIEELSNKISIQEAISHMCSPTGAPAYLLDSVIELFNSKMARYVDMLWPNASYSLKSFKENKSGEVRAKLSEFLSIHGKDRSTGSLSGGELRCLAICADLASLDTLESILGVNLNPLIWDEPLNDLDNSNRERVMEMLSRISQERQIVMVDHSSEVKSMFSKVIQVEKKNGITKLI